MSENNGHSPTPWRVERSPKTASHVDLRDARGTYIGSLLDIDNGVANADFILRVNAYDADQAKIKALEEAAFAALILCNSLGRDETTIAYDGRNDFNVTDKIRAALRLAEGKEGQD